MLVEIIKKNGNKEFRHVPEFIIEKNNAEIKKIIVYSDAGKKVKVIKNK